jgi:hypothetical protein
MTGLRIKEREPGTSLNPVFSKMPPRIETSACASAKFRA